MTGFDDVTLKILMILANVMFMSSLICIEYEKRFITSEPCMTQQTCSDE